MKQAVKYLFGVSLMALALAGCNKKEEPTPSKTTAEEAVQPTVVERPPVICDEVGLKNRVVNLVRDQMLDVSLDALGNPSNLAELERQLKARLAETNIEIYDIQTHQGECHAQLHIELPNKDVEFANKALTKAGIPTVAEQAQAKNVQVMGENLLVSDFAYQVDGEALAIDKNNPVIGLAANALAKAAVAMTQQNKANARKENAAVARPKTDIVPAPTVTLRPVERPKPPTPEEAILRPEDVPSGRPKPTESSQSTVGQSAQGQSVAAQPQPKPELKQKATTNTEAESKPKAQPEPKKVEPPVFDDEIQITIVETDETY